MKKLCLIAFIGATTIVNAASIDHIMNYTPEYNANPALQGAINTSSTVNYNPAGLVRLEDGLYVNGGLQFAAGEYSTEYAGQKYKTDLGSSVPNFSIMKKEGKKAFFWTVGGIAGGAGVEYKDGISKYATLQKTFRELGTIQVIGLPINFSNITLNGKAEGESRYIQTTLGGAFEINSKWSTSTALRVVHGQRKFKGTLNADGVTTLGQPNTIVNGIATTDAEREAWGFGGQFGLNYAATDRLNIGMRYDTKVKMNFKTSSTSKSTIFKMNPKENGLLGFDVFYPEYKDGFKGRRDLPAMLALGASYAVNDKWMTFAGGNYYFNKAANIDEQSGTPTGSSKKYKDGYELSLGSEYLLNDKWSWMTGFNYAITGAEADNYHDSDYSLDSTMIGTGAKYRYNPNLELIGSVAYFMYNTATANDVTYKKQTTVLGLGFTYKWN
ncbi:MAG: OmpP1/FadL family transporter [Fusobacteriaceae bacterium]